MARGALRAAAVAALAALAVGCGGRAGGAGPRGSPAARFYQLGGGVLVSVASPSARSFLPWTVQERVADLAIRDDVLWLAVNGRGLASLLPGDPRGMTAYFDPMLFAHRTLTTVLPSDGQLLVHLYYNAMLNTVEPEALSPRGVSLLLLDPRSREPGYSIVVPPIQAADPGWEAVGFAPVSPREFLVEWKRSGEETRFTWTWFQLAGRVQSEVTRDDFRRAMGYLPARSEAVPASVARAIAAATAAMGEPDVGASYLFPIRSQGVPLKVTRRLGGGDSMVTVPVFIDGESAAVLLPDCRLALVAPGAAVREVALPPLPDGFRYTDLARLGEWVVIPWEQVRFTDVGAAGILELRLAP